MNAREIYSPYLKAELDDEIKPHWEDWEDALRTLSIMEKEVFQRDEFTREYNAQKSSSNTVDADSALELLHRFSVIGYESRSGYGGSSWMFQYDNVSSSWDPQSVRFKVHPGLKEFAKLREDRR